MSRGVYLYCMDTFALTICSVDFKSADCLALNRELTERLNPGNDVRWVILDNNPAGENALPVRAKDKRFLRVPGVPRDQQMQGSHHHAAALNKSLKFIETRFALFLDPDFLVVMPAWIERVLRHMTSNNLGFFGAPYHPRWFVTYRYFPCVQCLFVDLDKVPVAHLDFTPGPFGVGRPNPIQYAQAEQLLLSLSRSGKAFIKRRLGFLLSSRRLVGTYRDTGYRIFRRYGKNRSVRHETIVPVYKAEDEFVGLLYTLSPFGKMLEWFLPNRLCYVPKRPGYYSLTGFREMGYAKLSSRFWDEYLWQNDPFGLHIHNRFYHEQKRGDWEDALGGLRAALLRDL